MRAFQECAFARALLLLGAATGCAGYAKPDVPDYEQWTRASFHLRRGRCAGSECTLMMRGSGGAVDVHRREREYRPHEIAGWDSSSRAQRLVAGLGQQLILGAGGFTERTRIALGTATVIDRADSTSRMTCTSFSIYDQTIVKNADGVDEAVRSRTRTSGVDCRITATSDTTRTLWRFRYGIAPARDSVAAIYDSLAAANAPQVSGAPPITIEAVDAPDGRRLRVTRDPRAVPDLLRVASRWYVDTEDGLRIGVIDLGVQATVHLSPQVRVGERKALRLIGAFLATSP
jgi:hypothetical protein